MKKLLILITVVLGLFFLASDSVYAQCPDTSDQGNCDTMWIEREPGRLQPNTSGVVRHVWGYHDENLSGISIPLKYKNPQTDVTLDSIRYHPNLGSPLLKDTVRDNAAGTMVMFAVWSDSLAAGVDTFFTMYFTTGASWDPATPNPIDTFTLPSGQGVSFTDIATHDIKPVYDPPGNLDVKDDTRPGNSGIPKTFSLSQNYPNPFNAVTVVSFALPKTGHVKLEIYNILGQKVKDLVDEVVTAGYKRVVWDGKDNSGSNVASGVYFYRIKTQDFVEVMKMTLLK